MLFSKVSAFLCPLFLMVDLNSVPNTDALILTKNIFDDWSTL